MQAQHQRGVLVHRDVQADILIEGHIAHTHTRTTDIIPLLLLDHHAFVGNTSPTGGASLTEDSTPSGQSHMRSRLLMLHLGCLTACIPVREWPPNNLQLQVQYLDTLLLRYGEHVAARVAEAAAPVY